MRLLYSSLLIPIAIGISSFAFAQTWEPLGTGITSWDTNELPVYTLCEYNGKLYAGGTFHNAGKLKTNYIASWDGKQWDTLSIGTNGIVTAMAVYKNALCVGGGFSKAGRKKANNVAEWVDTTRTIPAWHILGNGIAPMGGLDDKSKPDLSLYGYVIYALTGYKEELYATGNFTESGDGTRKNFIAKWNGYKWNKVGKPLYRNGIDYNGADSVGGGVGDDYSIAASAVLGNELYVSLGNNSTVPRIEKNNIYKWDGNKWQAAATGLTNMNKVVEDARIYTMAVYDSELYVAGSIALADGKRAHNIAKWDGKSWSVLGDGMGSTVREMVPFDGTVRSMVVYNGKLYVGGVFDSAGGKPAKSIACWDGHNWSAVGAGLSTGKYPSVANVNALCVYKGELYAGGSFTSSGGKTVMNIARLNLNGTKSSTKSKK